MFAMMIPMFAQAATLTTVTVKKTDADGNPLAGAVFTLTGIDNSRGTDYQADSGENGIAEFIDVAEGEYELTEKTAPQGYIKSDKTYDIVVSEGRISFVKETDNGTEYTDYETVVYVNDKIPVPETPAAVKSSQTGSNGNTVLLFALMLASGAAAVVCGSKRHFKA